MIEVKGCGTTKLQSDIQPKANGFLCLVIHCRPSCECSINPLLLTDGQGGCIQGVRLPKVTPSNFTARKEEVVNGAILCNRRHWNQIQIK